MKNKGKAARLFLLLGALCLAAVLCGCGGRAKKASPADPLIRLYGEMHGQKAYYDAEFELWSGYYRAGWRNLFVELPYYSAAFLNIWMGEDSNELLDVWFEEIRGSMAGNEHFYAFLQQIKESCPETVFFGTDVGHQFQTTGPRYLKYLEEHGLKDSESYRLAQTCMWQGTAFRDAQPQPDVADAVREMFMTSNFEDAYGRCGGGPVMGIYGAYHTDLSAPDVMASRLKTVYGDLLSSEAIQPASEEDG